MATMVTEFGMRTTRLIPGKCEWKHDRYVEVPVIDIVTKVDPVGYWLSHSYEEMKKNCNLMKIYMLWPILMINSGDNKQQHHQPWVSQTVEMTMKNLNYIELLEDLADLFKKVANNRRFIEDILRIGNKFDIPRHRTKASPIAEAVSWVQATGDQAVYRKLMGSHEHYRSQALFTFFYQYFFLLSKMGEECCTLTDKVKKHECYKCDEECERKKLCGNVAFDKGQYVCATQYYTAAMQYSPHNHILFGNRALCFIRLEDHWHALYDGKKAIVLKNTWPKGHYRFCEALFLLGEAERALASNKKAQELCRYCPDGIRNLIEQQARFSKLMEVSAGIKVKKNSKKKTLGEKIAAQVASGAANKETKEAASKSEDVPEKESTPECNVGNKKRPENMPGQQSKKGKSKGKGSDSERLRVSNLNSEIPKTPSAAPSEVDLDAVRDMVKCLVHEAYAALIDKRCCNAEGLFGRLLDILEQNDLQSLHLTRLDHLVLQYGHANALLGIGQCAELLKAENRFKVMIQHHSKERFNCLAFYGIGNVHFRQNRFSDALNQYIKSKTLVNHKMLPGVLTWPTMTVVIEETRPERLQVLLDNCIEQCKFPPKPDATCRYEQCLSLPKAQIYFSDPDFKGFIRLVCCHFCRVEFHVCCWKRMKATLYSDKNDKDFLKYSCLTPDCGGFVSHIVIFDSMAQVKCEFEDKTLKKKEAQKPTAKHKAASKSNKTKYDNKSERKKAAEEESVGNGDDPRKPEAPVCEASVTKNGCRVKWDPLLAQVLKKEGLIRRGCPACFPGFWESVCAWRVISAEELERSDAERSGAAQAGSKMKSFLSYLYRLNDRVKTRLFLYLLLRQAEHITRRLQEWLLIVNSKGLEAAVDFRERNRERLKSIKAESIVTVWNEGYGKNLDCIIDGSPDSLLEPLTCMNVEGFRCFLWLLEEHKPLASEHGLEKELERYFQEMDIPRGQVPKQSFENYNIISANLKTKHRRKKRNQPVKPTYKLSGAVSTRSQEEDIFTEENTLSLLDPNEPFLVPESLRDDVDDFEAFYELGIFGVGDRGPAAVSPEPIRETLYEYFSQILDEYGPLKPDDERLIGEYKDFPEETHRMVEEAGGLKSFLLQSDDFTIVDDTIALSAGYNIPFGEPRSLYQLNPTAEEFTPAFPGLACNNVGPYSAPSHDDSASTDSGATECSELPGFYSDLNLNYQRFAEPFNSPDLSALPGSEYDLIGSGSYEHLVLDDDLDEVHSYSSNGSVLSSIDEEDDDDEGDDTEPSTDMSQDVSCPVAWEQIDRSASSGSELQPRTVQTGIVSVQVDVEHTHHEVNTEPYQPFETQQGDILRMEKEHLVLKEQLQEATEKYENLQCRYQEEIAGLEERIRTAAESSKIAKTELVWLQQEYESETKKWQQERRENQEKLKNLKNSVKAMNEAIDKYTKGTEEKMKQYEAHIEDFAKIQCSKFENEKARLEKRIIKRKVEREEAAQRAAVAEVIVLENQKQGELLTLRMKASNAEQGIKMLKPVASGNPATLEQMSAMESYLLKLGREMDVVQSDYDEKITALKRSAKLSAAAATGIKPPSADGLKDSSAAASTPVSANPTPSPSAPVSANPSPSPIKPLPAKSPVKKTAANKKAKHKAANKPPTLPAATSHTAKTPAPSPAKTPGTGSRQQEARASPSAKPTPFDKIIEDLHDIFPHYDGAELANFIKDFRARNNGTLAGLTHAEVICRVTEHILDCQARSPPAPQNSAGLNTSHSGSGIAPPQPKQPWRVVTGGAKNKWQNSSDLESFGEDPCIICHDELKQFAVHKLDCGHFFHKHCIKTWLHTQSTCPTCREHALLPEDFPVLSGRMRTA